MTIESKNSFQTNYCGANYCKTIFEEIIFVPAPSGFCSLTIDAHGLKIQGEGQGGFCQILGGRVYRGCENFGGRVQLFGVLLHFY